LTGALGVEEAPVTGEEAGATALEPDGTPVSGKAEPHPGDVGKRPAEPLAGEPLSKSSEKPVADAETEMPGVTEGIADVEELPVADPGEEFVALDIDETQSETADDQIELED
jgi:hypothetical protein